MNIDQAIEVCRDLAPEGVAQYERCRTMVDTMLRELPDLTQADRDRLLRKVAAARESIEELAAAILAEGPVQ